ncbi:laccase 4 [Coprinopsis cinerea okayama7|uniref:Laccase 4 n=2 Tax=Coprinopsis cinerea TaxID=5346 RepID=Q08AC3_COPC7|nr:laccase 4 [Coprinopsis cinerea okayama7\|eukprot:XP_001829763.2 laccase 4 [Coprinopsis cinerea okayama7\
MRDSALPVLFLLFGLFPGIQGKVLSSASTLVVHNQFVAPDGFNRSAVLVNGVHPSPLIKANKGETYYLNVVNKLHDSTMLRSTSVHWHGLLQHGTAWADGSQSVSQCPISPGHSFEYRFPGGDQAGTFWYHSHFGTQYCDGLRGPFVIYDENDPYKHLYDVDDENTIITVADWYHTPAPSLPIPAFADSTLINGKGRYPGGPKVDLAIVNVVKGKRYRFRLLSLACEPNYQFSIDGHRMTIIEADGYLTEPVVVDRIQIFTGQRYSFILEANRPVANYWIRALPNYGNNGLTLGFEGGINSAILRYAGAPKSEPIYSNWPLDRGVQLLESMLHPIYSPPAPGPPVPGAADVNIYLDMGFQPESLTYTVNGSVFEPPSVPVLLQIMSGAKNAAELLPKGTLYPLKRNQVVELTVPGGLIGGPHPFHLHGHSFSVVKSAGSQTYNFDNPVRRDVTNAGEEGEEVVIRFETDNSGPWLFHCHVEFHLQMGLAIVFAEDIEGMVDRNPVPGAWKELCPIYDALPEDEKTVTILEPTNNTEVSSDAPTTN